MLKFDCKHCCKWCTKSLARNFPNENMFFLLFGINYACIWCNSSCNRIANLSTEKQCCEQTHSRWLDFSLQDIDVKTCNLSGLALSKKCTDVFSSMRFFIQIRLQHPFTVGEHVFRCLFPPAMASLPWLGKSVWGKHTKQTLNSGVNSEQPWFPHGTRQVQTRCANTI